MNEGRHKIPESKPLFEIGFPVNTPVKIQLNREQEAAFSPLFPVKNTT